VRFSQYFIVSPPTSVANPWSCLNTIIESLPGPPLQGSTRPHRVFHNGGRFKASFVI
jgi:hypothetical protein